MSNLVKLPRPKKQSNNSLYSEKNGKKLYKQNENYRSISNLMEHPEFRDFYNKHFSNWDNLKTIIMFLKLYEEIEKHSSTPLNGYQKLDILDKIIKTGELRHKICKEFYIWSSNKLTIS